MERTKVHELDGAYVLLTDSQEVRAVLETIGAPHLEEAYPALFVLVGEGEYLEVWGCFRAVPRLEDWAERLL